MVAVRRPLVIDAQEVRRVLPMIDCVDAMEIAMRGLSSGRIATPQRSFVPLADDSAVLGVMPGSSLEPEIYGVKVISLHRDNPRQGLPAIQGFVALFDHRTGAPLAFVDGAEITAMRTAAASALATRYLSREGARSLGLFGAGVQARSHLEAICAVRPIEEVRVWARDPERAKEFAEQQSRAHDVSVRAASGPEAAECDVVCTVTGSAEPVLQGASVPSGTHVNLVGAHTLDTREADAELMRRARVWVDSRQSARNESGNIALAVKEGAFDWDAVVGEIGEVAAGRVPARQRDEEVTVYVSLGVVAQDLVAAEAVYRSVVEQRELS